MGHLKTSRNPSFPFIKRSIQMPAGRSFIRLLWFGLGACWLIGCLGNSLVWAAGEADLPLRHIRSVIPILGTTKGEEAQPVGIVAEIILDFTHRRDHAGLQVIFETAPGRFSLFAQESVIRAIHHVVAAAQLNPDSWTVRFSLPYPGVTLFGESLSAMAALNVVALAKNEPVAEDTVMTGTVTAEGSLGVVGGVPLKIRAAYQKHYRKVVIPEELDVADGDWETPFLMEVTPVRSIHKAYFALTHRTLHPLGQPQTVAASLVR